MNKWINEWIIEWMIEGKGEKIICEWMNNKFVASYLKIQWGPTSMFSMNNIYTN